MLKISYNKVTNLCSHAFCRYKLDLTFFFNFFSWKITFPVAYCWDRNCSLIVLYRAKSHTLSMGWWTFIFSWRGNSDQNYNLPSFLSSSCSPAPFFHTNRLWIIFALWPPLSGWNLNIWNRSSTEMKCILHAPCLRMEILLKSFQYL